MRKLKQIMKAFSYSIFAIQIPTSIFLVSCSKQKEDKENMFKFVSSSNDILQTKNQQASFTFVYVGSKDVQKIQSIEIKDPSLVGLKISSQKQELELDEKKQFTIKVQLKNAPTKIDTINFSIIIVFPDSYKIPFQIIDNLSVQSDYHEIQWTNPGVVNNDPNAFVSFDFQMDGLVFPKEIQSVEILGGAKESLEIFETEAIVLDENHKFSLGIKNNDYEIPQAKVTNFKLEFNFIVNGQVISQTTDATFSLYYVSLTHIKTSEDTLWYDNQNIRFDFRLNLPDRDTVNKIDNVTIYFEKALPSGSLFVKEPTDITVYDNNEFYIDCVYQEVDPGVVLGDTTIWFDFKFKTSSGENIETLCSDKFTLNWIGEPDYQKHYVNITAIDNCDVSIKNSGIDNVSPYNVQYTTDSTFVKYEIPSDGQQGDVIHLEPGQSVEFKNDSNSWSEIDKYLSFSFTTPVMIQGDITSLLDGQGGQIKDISSWPQVFNSLFRDANIFKVSDNFLTPTTLSNGCYVSMFENSTIKKTPELPATDLKYHCYESMFKDCKNLLFAPKKLPAERIRGASYAFMFEGCEALKQTPLISACDFYEDADEQFKGMFKDCKLLERIYIPYWSKEFGTDNFYREWFEWVKGVSDTGTFYYNGKYTEQTDEGNAIPINWTIEKY